jgi:hypothetical protein
MPLDNTATIKDIIAQFESLQGINAKADLASVVGSPATANDSMATINSVLQSAKNELADKMGGSASGAQPLQTLVSNLAVGKKWASGNVMTSGTGVFEVARNTSTVNMPKVIFAGLTFRPNIIVAKVYDGSYKTSISTYLVGGDQYYSDTIKVAPFTDMNTSETTFNLKVGVRDAYITTEGFSLPVIFSGMVDWIAFE